MRLAFELVDWVKQMALTSTCEHHPICWGLDGTKNRGGWICSFLSRDVHHLLPLELLVLGPLGFGQVLYHPPPDSQVFKPRHCWLSWFSRLLMVDHGTSWPPFSRQFPVLSINSASPEKSNTSILSPASPSYATSFESWVCHSFPLKV